MDLNEASTVLAALALGARLSIFRLLVQAGPRGVRAGDIAEKVRSPGSTLSANLKILRHARLIERRREGRTIVYTARYDQMSQIISFLLEDCCGGSPEICRPLMDIATRAICCADDQAECEAQN